MKFSVSILKFLLGGNFLTVIPLEIGKDKKWL
jgi:hypothetical protein